MTCLLSKCPHLSRGHSACKSLGMCGAKFALHQAAKPGGYTVRWRADMRSENKTIAALERGGLVKVESINAGEAVVTSEAA